MSWHLQNSATPIRVLTAIVGAHEGKVAELIAAAHPQMILARRCADVPELLATAHIGLGTVAVISTDLPGLDRQLVQTLRSERVGLIVLNDVEDQLSVQRLAALGITEALTYLDLDGYLLDSIARSHALTATDRAPSAPQSPPDPASPAFLGVVPEPPAPENAEPRGKAITVWGTSGAPGRTMVATNLAYALSRADKSVRGRKTEQGSGDGQSTLLIDADTHAPSITQVLGLLDESSGLARACHGAGQGLLDPAHLWAHYAQLAPQLHLLTGLPRTTRWPEILAANLEAVLHHAKYNHRWVIADCAASTESDEILSFDTMAPQRNAATLTCLQESDCVIVVGKGDPVGLKRLIDALTEVQENPAFDGAAISVVVNQVRGTTAGPGTKTAISEMLAQYCQILEPVFIPYDPAAVDKALMTGRSLLDHTTNSAAAKELLRLAKLIRTHLTAREQGPEYVRTRSTELGRQPVRF